MKKDVSWLLMDRVLRLINGLVVTATIARILGPAEFGIFSVSMASIAVFVAAAGMGAEHINTAEMTKQAVPRQQFLTSALFARGLWSIVCMFGALALLSFENDAIAATVMTILLCTVPLAIFSIFVSALNAIGDFKATSIISSSTLLAGAIARMSGVMLGFGIKYLAVCVVVESLLTALAFIWYTAARHKLFPALVAPMQRDVFAYLKLCLPTAVSSGLITVYLRLELFFVAWLLDNHAVGLWSAAMLFVMPWGILASSVLPVVNRKLALRQIEDSTKYEQDLVKLIRSALLLGMMAVPVNIITAYFLTSTVLGPQYVSIIPIVCICSFAIIPLMSGSVQDIWIAQQKSTSIVIKKILLGLPISSILLWLFASRFGLLGAAGGMVVSYFATAVILNMIFDKKFLLLQMRALGIKNA